MSVCIVKIKANWHTGAAVNANELMGKEGSASGSGRQLSKDAFYVVWSGLKSSLLHDNPHLASSVNTPELNSNYSKVNSTLQVFWGKKRVVKGPNCRENRKKLLV